MLMECLLSGKCAAVTWGTRIIVLCSGCKSICNVSKWHEASSGNWVSSNSQPGQVCRQRNFCHRHLSHDLPGALDQHKCMLMLVSCILGAHLGLAYLRHMLRR